MMPPDRPGDRWQLLLASFLAGRSRPLPPLAVPDVGSVREVVGHPFDVPRREDFVRQAAYAHAVSLAATSAPPEAWVAALAEPWQVAPAVPGEPFPGLAELRGYVAKLDEWARAEPDPVRAFHLAGLANGIGGHLRDSEAYFIQMLVACSALVRANRLTQEIAVRPEARPWVQEVLSGWTPWSARETFMHCLVAEVRDFMVPEATQTPPLWSMDMSHGIIPIQVQLQWQRWLVSGHPEPYDVLGTLRTLGDDVRALMGASQPLAELDRIIEAQVGDLEEELYASPMIVGPARLVDVWAGRRSLRRGANPVGRLTIGAALHSARSVLVALMRAEFQTSATRVTLASVALDRRPNSLQELVEAQLLPAIPTDPFTGQPLGYANGRLTSEGDGKPLSWALPDSVSRDD